jgi:nucleoside-diphosphate-sugar epimerase
LNEYSALHPVSLYARSKIASEQVLLKMKTNDFAPVILRFGTIYGLSGRTRFDLVVNLLAAKAVIDGEITVYGSDQWRPFIHVEDAGRAIVKALEAERSLLHDAIFNVGSDEQNRTLGQIGRLIQSMVPDAKLIAANLQSDRRNYRVDFRRIRDVLDFRAEWTLEQGVQQVLDAITEGKVMDYRDAKYSNVKYLTEELPPEVLKAQNGWAHDMISREMAAGKRA